MFLGLDGNWWWSGSLWHRNSIEIGQSSMTPLWSFSVRWENSSRFWLRIQCGDLPQQRNLEAFEGFDIDWFVCAATIYHYQVGTLFLRIFRSAERWNWEFPYSLGEVFEFGVNPGSDDERWPRLIHLDSFKIGSILTSKFLSKRWVAVPPRRTWPGITTTRWPPLQFAPWATLDRKVPRLWRRWTAFNVGKSCLRERVADPNALDRWQILSWSKFLRVFREHVGSSKSNIISPFVWWPILVVYFYSHIPWSTWESFGKSEVPRMGPKTESSRPMNSWFSWIYPEAPNTWALWPVDSIAAVRFVWRLWLGVNTPSLLDVSSVEDLRQKIQ